MLKRKNKNNNNNNCSFWERVLRIFFGNKEDRDDTLSDYGKFTWGDYRWHGRYRGDGFGGIATEDVQEAIDNLDLQRDSCGILYDDDGNQYDDDGMLL